MLKRQEETMAKPVAILDPQWRRLDELFSTYDLNRLRDMCDVVWGQDGHMPEEMLSENLAQAQFYLSANPIFNASHADRARNLRAIIELYGAFPDTVDYQACFAHGVEVLSTGPGMRGAVAEMALAMALAGARGLVQEHENFRAGQEHWFSDNDETDFSLYGANIGFVGFGQIARELSRLLKPFDPKIMAYDPWIDPASAEAHGARLGALDEVARFSRCLFVTAAPTRSNAGLVDARTIAALPNSALVVVVSRAHVVDFPALTDAVRRGAIRAAIDVHPVEPPPLDDPIRSLPDVILSPHRAAAVKDGRQLMGRLIVQDIERMIAGQTPANLARARPENIGELAGVQHSKKLEDMCEAR
jgi:phosphoglycerate dehydrogenase-like enzyme